MPFWVFMATLVFITMGTLWAMREFMIREAGRSVGRPVPGEVELARLRAQNAELSRRLDRLEKRVDRAVSRVGNRPH